MEQAYFKDLPLKIRPKTVYNVGVSSQDAPFYYPAFTGTWKGAPEKYEKER